MQTDKKIMASNKNAHATVTPNDMQWCGDARTVCQKSAQKFINSRGKPDRKDRRDGTRRPGEAHVY